MTVTDWMLVALLIVLSMSTGFEVGKVFMQQKFRVKVFASFSDVMNGVHLWKPAFNPPDDDRFVYTCINLGDDKPCAIGVSYFKDGEWYNMDNLKDVVDYWMDVPSLPKKEDKNEPQTKRTTC